MPLRTFYAAVRQSLGKTVDYTRRGGKTSRRETPRFLNTAPRRERRLGSAARCPPKLDLCRAKIAFEQAEDSDGDQDRCKDRMSYCCDAHDFLDHQRLAATTAQMTSMKPNGHAPCRKP